MYNVTNDFITAIKSPSRTVKARILVGAQEITLSNIVNFSIESSIGNNNLPTIGGAVSSKLQLKLINDVSLPQVLIGVPITVFVSVETLPTVFEELKLGIYYADYADVKKTQSIIELVAFDKMAYYNNQTYSTALEFPVSLETFIADLTTSFGITFDDIDFSTYELTINVAPEGTLRQVISYLASLLTANATLSEDEKIKFIFYTPTTFSMDTNNYVRFVLTSDAVVDITQLQIGEKDEDVFIYGNNTGFALRLLNPFITNETELGVVYNRFFPYTYQPYSLECQGFPHLQVGDVISITDKQAVTRNILLANHKLTFKGGLSSSFKVEAPKDTTTTTNTTSGSTVGDSLRRTYQTLTVAIEEASKLITGNNGGYVITILDEATGKPKELVIADNDDINIAEKVWRWNATGLGYSNTGYNGAYSTAITADGAIVADFITIGSMNVSKIGGLQDILNGFSSAITLNNSNIEFAITGIKTINDEGVTIVSNSLVTINEQGIVVTKSGEDLSTTLTNEGLYVIRDKGQNDEVVMLKANSNVVEAENITVRTYLVIGKNSRMEDYQTGTGVFYIGG